MLMEPVEAGTVLFLDFNTLNFVKPEMVGAHPVLVLTPKGKQRSGTLVVVPLTSEEGNCNNPDAIEIMHKGIVGASPTGRSFAICDKPVAVSLTRLDHYNAGHRAGRNYQPDFRIRGEELQLMRLAVLRSISPDSEFNDYLKNEHPEFPKKIRVRNLLSKKMGRVKGPLLGPLSRKRRRRTSTKPKKRRH